MARTAAHLLDVGSRERPTTRNPASRRCRATARPCRPVTPQTTIVPEAWRSVGDSIGRAMLGGAALVDKPFSSDQPFDEVPSTKVMVPAATQLGLGCKPVRLGA